MKSHPCPICRVQVQPGTKTWPFCSERCRLIDLGNWLGNKYVVPGDEQPSSDGGDDHKH